MSGGSREGAKDHGNKRSVTVQQSILELIADQSPDEVEWYLDTADRVVMRETVGQQYGLGTHAAFF